MVRTHRFGLTLFILLAGCATLRPGGDDPARSLDAGLRALAAGDYGNARGHLDRAGSSPNGGELAQRALFIGTLAQLDPRNPDRDFAAAAERAAAMRRATPDDNWLGVAGEVLVELSAELSGVRARVRRADREWHQALTTAAIAQASVDARVAAVAIERDSARREAADLAKALADKEKELKEKTQELERIKRTIRR